MRANHNSPPADEAASAGKPLSAGAAPLAVLVVHYNNPDALAATLSHLVAVLGTANGAVVDNSTDATAAAACREICARASVRRVDPHANLGWGAAINFAIASEVLAEAPDETLVLVAAHDAHIARIDLNEIRAKFADPAVGAVSPTNVAGTQVAFTPARFFHFVPFVGSGTVVAGHMTACVFRLATLRRFAFDPEFFLYGCESEIFLRTTGAGVRTVQLPSFLVENPSTDSMNRFVDTAFAINSIYTARKYAGTNGALARASRITLSALRMLAHRQPRRAWSKLTAVVWALSHPGRGLRTFLDPS